MIELVKINWPKLIMKNPNNFFLRHAYKTEGDAHNFQRNLISEIVFFR